MRLPQRSTKAFTLIELIVVIVILGLLALIAIPTFGKVIDRSGDESTLTSLRAIARNAQALRALDQTSTWGTAPQDAIGETSTATSTGLFAAKTKATSDTGVDPVKGEVVYKVVDTDRLALSALSPSGRICMVGLTVTAVTSGKCVTPHPVAGAVPVSTLSGEVQSDTSLLPVSPTSGTGSTPAPSAANPGAFTLTTALVGNKPSLSWTASTNATFYKVERASKADFTDAVVLATSQTALTYQDAAAAGTWFYRVSALGTQGTSPMVRTGVATVAAPVTGSSSSVILYGGSGDDYGSSSVMGSDGTLYTVGYTTSSLAGTNKGSFDAFITALNADGTSKWTKQYGTTGSDLSRGIVLGADGTLYVSGYTGDSLVGTSAGGTDIFVLALNSSDGSEKWTKQYGSAGADVVQGMAAGADGTLYVTGYSNGALASSAGGYDAYILALNPMDGSQKWVKQYGGASTDYAYGITVGSTGTVYITGSTLGSLVGTNKGGEDIFVLAVDPANGSQQWLRQLGTSMAEVAFSVAERNGSLYVTGYSSGSLGGPNVGGNDVVVINLNSSTGADQWVKQYGGSSGDVARGIIAASDGSIYVTGNTSGTFGAPGAGSNDFFVLGIDADGTQKWVKQYGTPGVDTGQSLMFSADGTLYATGYAGGSIGGATAQGGIDAAIIKIK